MLRTAGMHSNPRRVVLLDAAFEATLGAIILTGLASGAISGSDFPSVTDLTLGVVGCCLLALAAALVWLARRRPGTSTLLGLALTNDLTVLLGIGWLLAAHRFTLAGALLVALALAGLAILSLLQIRLAIASPNRGGRL
jgi:hypothetical protein